LCSIASKKVKYVNYKGLQKSKEKEGLKRLGKGLVGKAKVYLPKFFKKVRKL